MVLVLLLFSASPYLMSAQARSVHSTATVDLFPQGDFTNSGSWEVGAETSFTQESATYTESMVADQRLTMLHNRPLNLDTLPYGPQPPQPIQITQRALPTVRAPGPPAPKLN